MKVVFEPGPSSADTHRLTQRSNTLNRRFVGRPSNLAIEEAARMADYREHNANNAKTGPSRLVNLQIHDKDLAAAQAEIATRAALEPAAQPKPKVVRPKLVEFGTPIVNTAEDEVIEIPEVVEAAPMPESEISLPTPTPSTISLTVPSPATVEEIPDEPLAPIKNADLDTSELAMNIAADYTAATLGATMSNLPTRVDEVDTDLSTAVAEAHIADSIDEIAQTVSDYIAKIRGADTADEITEHIDALKDYTADIRSRCNTPEVIELATTIEKFIAVTEKSTGIKNSKTIDQKASLTSKANRAAEKVNKSTAKAVTKATISTNKTTSSARTKTVRTSLSATRPTRSTMSLSKTASLSKKSAKPSSNRQLNNDATLRKAMRSVAKMNETSTYTRPKRVRREGYFKRFALAFGCAIIAVAGIVYFVATNIPDISVKVAALQAGVDSTYPSYIPAGFSLDKIESEENQIMLTFANSENKTFTLTEKKSSWDSTALERNYAKTTWGSNYSTTHEQGITIFIHESSAVWVNGGVMSIITAEDGVLTTKQLRSIVTSMQ